MVDLDIDKICRVCLQSNIELSLLFDELNSVDGVCLSDMITECTMYTVQRHDDFPHLICDECIEKVRNAYRFKKQFETSHRRLITFLDSVNKVIIDTKFNNSVDKSIQTEETTLYPCEKCEEKLMNYQSLKDHRSDSHKGTANESFTAHDTGSSLAPNHHGGHYDDNVSSGVELAATNPFINEEEDEKLLSTIQNLKKAETNGLDSIGHLVKLEPSDKSSLTTETYECQTPDYAMAKKPYQMSEPYQRIQNGRYKCAECEKTFSKSSHVKRHFLLHTREKPYSCTVCGKQFARADHCRNHIFRHDDERVFPCDCCDQFYDCLEDLQRHTDQMHKADVIQFKMESDDNVDSAISVKQDEAEPTDTECTTSNSKSFDKKQKEGKYKCHECYKTFTRRNHVKRHLISHREEKPFACSVCDKRFGRHDNLKVHLTKHNKERAHVQADLFKTINAVTPLTGKTKTCEICNKSFSRKSNLQRHLLSHQGLKIY